MGDIPVVWFDGNPLPMVHRASRVFYGGEGNTTRYERLSGDQEGFGTYVIRQVFVTKGDNNELEDIAMYPDGRVSVERGEVVGFVRGYLPLLGWLVIALQEVVWLKYVLISLFAGCDWIS